MKPQLLLTTISLLAGTAFTFFIVFFKSDGGGLTDWVFSLAFVSGPWLLLDTIFIWDTWVLRKNERLMVVGFAIAAVLMLGLELLIYYSVFVHPNKSTDSLVYVVKPFLELFIIVPIGILVGWVNEKRITYNESLKIKGN